MKHAAGFLVLLVVSGCGGNPPSLAQPKGEWASLNSLPPPRIERSQNAGVQAPPRVLPKAPALASVGTPAVAFAAPEVQKGVVVMATGEQKAKSPVVSEHLSTKTALPKTMPPAAPGAVSAPLVMAQAKAPVLTSLPSSSALSSRPLAPTLPVWRMEKGTTLKAEVMGWAARAKCRAAGSGTWQVRWETPVNYPIDAPLRFEGEFNTALLGVLELYQQAKKPLYAEISSPQCLVRIAER
ncbi:hypothetical protein C5U62_31480 [Pseudomonas protegens]|uniref:Toxin co-regulated pilus biosynthesis protein Q C-terminal domain-containing protein n=1 Tax=Pseudomonas protegens TaxID=380021 RepID=A0A2T6GBG2_9PSED|nr:toxin co-regulated pilus biosynthesis Q family protein [Pseudomonas protegens]PUA41492.1 hypothetical protein C5U62_31480 [Pseudomonas protegens]